MLGGLLHGHGRSEAWAQADRMYSSVRRFGDAGDWDALARIFTDYFSGDGSWAATPPEWKRIIASQLPPNRHEWDAGAPSMTAQSFGGIRARTLMLRGSQTPLPTRETVEVLREAFPHWQLHEIPGAGHMGPLTHAPIVNAEIETFLGPTNDA